MKDWRNQADYAYTANLTRDQLAWEFLRRNPDYEREWKAFWQVWQELEAAYGSPPNRDFNSWKRDPRAWVPAAECEQGDCRVDRDKVLIECALGARWGFYKFPVNPAEDDPFGQDLLVWRNPERTCEPLNSDDQEYLGADPGKVALGFDLALPLREQLDQAKRRLQVLQRQRRQRGELQALTSAGWRERLTLYLRLLDAAANAATREAMGELCRLDELEPNLTAARELSAGGYRRILLLVP